MTPPGQALFRTLYEAAQSFVLTTHVNPDGDALGSEFSLARFLLSKGKRVRVVNHDPTPDTLRFIEDVAYPVEVYQPDEHDAVLRGADLVVLLDNSAPDRLGRMEPVMCSVANRTLCIDHHPSRGSPWAHLILDEQSCAATVMVYELTRACGWTPDRKAAEAIYVGLATDTGFFRFNSTTARAHRVAAELIGFGARPARAYLEIYERNSEAYTRLLGHALVGLAVGAGGAIAAVKLDRELIARLGAEDIDSSEITTALLAMEGVRIAALFRALPGEKVKVSLRSKADVDVHRLATEFGGGGHRNASGIVMAGDLEDAVSVVLDRAEKLLARAGRKGP